MNLDFSIINKMDDYDLQTLVSHYTYATELDEMYDTEDFMAYDEMPEEIGIFCYQHMHEYANWTILEMENATLDEEMRCGVYGKMWRLKLALHKELIRINDIKNLDIVFDYFLNNYRFVEPLLRGYIRKML